MDHPSDLMLYKDLVSLILVDSVLVTMHCLVGKTSKPGRTTLKGVAQLVENEVITMAPEAKPESTGFSLRNSVRQSLQQYFAQLDGQTPSNLYGMVLAEVEKPLIEMVLQLTNGNQSKAAIVMGISRGTLRKKMAQYGLL